MKRFSIPVLFCFILLNNNINAIDSNDLFPKIDNWKLNVESTVYTPHNLWELINGAADAYLSYDFVDLHVAYYTSGDKEIYVQLYHHKDAANTFGIYTQERMPDYSFIEIGIQGYYEPGVLHFFTDKYYVKLSNSGSKDATKEEFILLAKKIAEKTVTTKNWPKPVSVFPKENKIEYSEGYINKDFLGYSFLHSAFTSRYKFSDKVFQLFVISLNSEEEVKAMIGKYAAMLNEDKVQKENNFYSIDDLFNGKIYLYQLENYLIGTSDLTNKETAKEYIEKIKERIKN